MFVVLCGVVFEILWILKGITFLAPRLINFSMLFPHLAAEVNLLCRWVRRNVVVDEPFEERGALFSLYIMILVYQTVELWAPLLSRHFNLSLVAYSCMLLNFGITGVVPMSR